MTTHVNRVSTDASAVSVSASKSSVAEFSRVPVLQRACACQGSQSGAGECEGCKKKKASLQRSPFASQAPSAAPPIVHDVLRTPGQPLDPAARRKMETRFGRDFSAVRVHADSRASESAEAVRALAYTVGSHVVFGAGRYQPGSPWGARLLAHELTHVVQQRGAEASVQRHSISAEPSLAIGPENDAAEREAERASKSVDEGGSASVDEASAPAVQRHVAIRGYDEAGPKADLSGKKDDELFNCMKDARADPDACSPNRALTWADFTGAAPGGKFAALTAAPVTDVPMDPVRASCLQRILGKSKDETRIFQAKLNSASSWVRPKFKSPTNAALNGCNTIVAQCESFFNKLKPGETGDIGMTGTPDPDCAASVMGDPSKKATSKAECKTVVGVECANASQQESDRLLAHEQGHMDVSCVIAKKATQAIEAGTPLAEVKAAVASKLQPLDDAYDAESTHGCDAGGQAAWIAKIANSLPDVTIP